MFRMLFSLKEMILIFLKIIGRYHKIHKSFYSLLKITQKSTSQAQMEFHFGFKVPLLKIEGAVYERHDQCDLDS